MARHAVAAALAFVAAAMLAPPRTLTAQSGQEGIFLLLPVGARAVGMGEAVVAQRGGSDMLWWNPAAIAGNGPSSHEVALHHSTTVVGQGNALAIVWPTRTNKSAFGLAVNVLDLGQQTLTNDQGASIGVATPTDYSVAVTYALAPFSWLSLGATAKHVEAGIQCSGECGGLGIASSRSNGFDVGMQFRPAAIPLTLAAAGRNLGIAGAAGRPGRLDFGADYVIVAFARGDDRVDVHGAADLVTTTNMDSTTARVGTDIVIDERLHVRAGYIRDQVNGSGGALGVGLQSGKLMFDIGRTYGGLTGTNDKPPTYFSLRYLW